MRRFTTGEQPLSALTEQEQAVLEFIVEFIDLEGYPPTIREIMSGVELPSIFTTCARLTGLRRKGKISTKPYKARSIKVIGA